MLQQTMYKSVALTNNASVKVQYSILMYTVTHKCTNITNITAQLCAQYLMFNIIMIL